MIGAFFYCINTIVVISGDYMKPTLKLSICDTDPSLATFFYYIISSRYSIELDDKNPDFLLFGDENFGVSNLNYSRNDVTKIFYTGENRRPENYDCDYAVTFDYNFNPWHYRLPLFIIYMWAFENIHKMPYTYDYIFAPEVKNKTGFASFVVSNPHAQERVKFFHDLSKYKHVDSGGRYLNNIGRELKGEQAKLDFLSDKKFNISFENGSHPGYVTEKILTAFYAGTIPIYWGTPLVSLDFNDDAFINCHRFKSFEDTLEYVQKVDQDDDLYNHILQQPKFKFNCPPTYMMLNNFLNWFDAAVNGRIQKRAK